MLDYYLKMEPHLLSAAIEKQLEQLQSEKDKASDPKGSSTAMPDDNRDLVLYR